MKIPASKDCINFRVLLTDTKNGWISKLYKLNTWPSDWPDNALFPVPKNSSYSCYVTTNYRPVQTASFATVQILNVLNIQFRSSMNFLPGFIWKNNVKPIKNERVTLNTNPDTSKLYMIQAILYLWTFESRPFGQHFTESDSAPNLPQLRPTTGKKQKHWNLNYRNYGKVTVCTNNGQN